jgi:hypothetical protein
MTGTYFFVKQDQIEWITYFIYTLEFIHIEWITYFP